MHQTPCVAVICRQLCVKEAFLGHFCALATTTTRKLGVKIFTGKSKYFAQYLGNPM